MRVFVTGASGHLGSAIVPELLEAGHHVIGLARSSASAEKLTALGASVRRGDLDDLDDLCDAAASADGVIHLAFKHDEMRAGEFDAAMSADLAAVNALGEALEGTGKPFVGTSGTLGLTFAPLGRTGTEDDVLPGGPRIDAENAVIALAERGVRSSIVRVPPITHSHLDHKGFTHTMIAIALATGTAGYPGDGANRWPAGHTLDVGHLYRLALESAPPGTRLHAVGDLGIPLRDIAEAIGSRLGLPVQSVPLDKVADHFGFLAQIIVLDNPTSNTKTRELLGWEPTHSNLFEDLRDGHYFDQ